MVRLPLPQGSCPFATQQIFLIQDRLISVVLEAFHRHIFNDDIAMIDAVGASDSVIHLLALLGSGSFVSGNDRDGRKIAGRKMGKSGRGATRKWGAGNELTWFVAAVADLGSTFSTIPSNFLVIHFLVSLPVSLFVGGATGLSCLWLRRSLRRPFTQVYRGDKLNSDCGASATDG